MTANQAIAPSTGADLAADVPSIYVCGLAAYDGTDYFGFQYQARVPTIQGTLEKALSRFTSLDGRVAGAGRTDTGVHALGQVVAVRVRWRHSLQKLQDAWNAHLPPSISVRGVHLAPDEKFHPRFSALWRTYRYSVYMGAANAPALRVSPLTDRFAWFEPRLLNVEAMQEACQWLAGEHDFAAFGHPTQGEETVRRVTAAEWREFPSDRGPWREYPGRHIVFTVTANGFLRKMVRRLVGTLLEVGRGVLPARSVKQILETADLSRSAAPAAARGLVFEQVGYPADLDCWAKK